MSNDDVYAAPGSFVAPSWIRRTQFSEVKCYILYFWC